MAGHGGGAWKVAYADFVTAMMAFFLVMWLVAQDQPVKEAIAQYFRDPFAIPSDAPSSSAPGPTFMPMESPVAPPPAGDADGKKGGGGDVAKKGPRTVLRRPSSTLVYRDGNRSSVGAQLPFVGEDAALGNEARESLAELIPMLAGKRNLLEIRSHASAHPLPEGSPYPDRWQLAFARCAATREYLISQGVAPERIRMSQSGDDSSAGDDADPSAGRVEVYMLDEFAADQQGDSQGGAPAPAAHEEH